MVVLCAPSGYVIRRGRNARSVATSIGPAELTAAHNCCAYQLLIHSQKVSGMGKQCCQGTATAGLAQPVHPHQFHHQMITYLTLKGSMECTDLTDLPSHESKKSLESYRHLSRGAVEQTYQEAVQGFSI
jgi:site-specific recombinase XerD